MTLSGTFGERVSIDPAQLAQFIREGNGPVVRDLLRRGDRVKTRARELVGVSKRAPMGRGGRRPGTLRDSIVKRLVEEGGMPVVLVGSEDPIALWHHEGTVPHVIEARNAPMLVFYWDRVGSVVAFPRVNHPGTQPNRFLVNALPAASG